MNRREVRMFGAALAFTMAALALFPAHAQGAASPQPVAAADKVVNINTAGVDELVVLPGIGKAYAERIVEYRQKNGPFKKVEDILNVRGIGEKTFERIREHLTVGKN